MDKIINFLTQKKLVSLVIILVLTTLVYSNIFSNKLVWDDPDFYQNWLALYSYKNIPNLLAGELPPQHLGVYRPLRSVFQLVIIQLLGTKISTIGTENITNTFGFHLISLIIHLAGVLGVYFFIEILGKNRAWAFLTALIFALHPIHVEAITYLTTSIDVIGVVLLFWSIYFYLKSQEINQKINYLISIILAWLAFFTYEITLVLPLLLILADLYKNDFDWQKLKTKIKYYFAYFTGVFLWLIIRLSLSAKIKSRALSSTLEITTGERILTTSKAFLKYLYLLFVPYPLNVYHKIDFAKNLFETKVILSVLTLLALVILAFVLTKKSKVIAFCIFWFFLGLAAVANIFPTGIVMAEKYTYLSSLSISLFLGWSIYLLLKQEKRIIQAFGIILILAITIPYGYLTYARNADWQSDEVLWQKTLKQRPDYGRVYNNLGFVHAKNKDYQKALEYLEKAKELEPNLPIIYQNLGSTYDELGEYEKAIAHYQKAIELKGELAETYNNLGVVYRKLNQLDQALASYQKAIETDPLYFISYSNTGVIYLMQENWDKAQEYFQKALELNPNFGQAHHGLAITYVNQKEYEKATEHYEKSMSLMPELTDNYNHLASIYLQQNNQEKAIEILRKGVTANPTDAELHFNLGVVLANNKQSQEAVTEIKKVLELEPNYPKAQETIDKILEIINQ